MHPQLALYVLMYGKETHTRLETDARENINALPLPLRRYILDLESNTDPNVTLRENFRLRQENEELRKECERLSNMLRVRSR
jgi:hypothetical protein